MIDVQEYQLADPSQLLTPCLLVYPDLIRNNLLESIRIAGSTEYLRPHVKTHKTPEIVQMEIDVGINKHKCSTLFEAQVLADCGAEDVLIGYPQIGPAIEKLAELVTTNPKTRFSTVVDDAKALIALDRHFAHLSLPLAVFVDIDTGMHRTGIAPGAGAVELYGMLGRSSVLKAAGLHVYDGQNHQSKLEDRRAAVATLMESILKLLVAIRANGQTIPTMVCGGTPTFPVFSQFELPDQETVIECSPGTCVLSDFNYGNEFRDLNGIQHAAVLMTRVISKQHPNSLTVDLGYKAVASDPPAGRRCHFLTLPDARVVVHNEEHLVLESEHASDYQVGDVLYAIPGHVCPTVALHSHLQVVENGQLVDSWRVAARDRIYR